MTGDLLWPGLHRAGGLFGDARVVAAMVEVEAAWSAALERVGLAPAGSAAAVGKVVVTPDDLAALVVEAEGGGNPLIPLLGRIRAEVQAESPDAAAAVHRGLTSQDVVDTALVRCAQACLEVLGADLDHLVASTAALADRHRRTLMAARTLGQRALPTTFGARAAGWCQGLDASREQVTRCLTQLPVQAGGAAGTMAATVDVCRAAGSADPVAAAEALVRDLAHTLGLQAAPPWHTARFPVTAIGDALGTASDALGHLANDVVLQSRPELGELSEPAGPGRGVSSAMPQKRNPVLSVLIRRHAMSAPLLAAQLHVAAAGAVDERPDGAWHVEWAALRDLCRRTVSAARQAVELVDGIEVHVETMRANLEAALPGILAERLVPALAAALPGGQAQAMDLLATSANVDDLVLRVTSADGARLTADEVRALADPTAYLGWADRLVDLATLPETVRR
jgi:3-carboxy-cis,cis-muconate cycloisomerase